MSMSVEPAARYCWYRASRSVSDCGAPSPLTGLPVLAAHASLSLWHSLTSCPTEPQEMVRVAARPAVAASGSIAARAADLARDITTSRLSLFVAGSLARDRRVNNAGRDFLGVACAGFLAAQASLSFDCWATRRRWRR